MELFEDGLACPIHLILGQALGGDFQCLRGTGAHNLHQLRCDTGGILEGFLYLLGAEVSRRHVELRTAFKVKGQVKAAERNGQNGRDEQHAGDGVPGFGPAHEVESAAVHVETVKAGNLAVSGFDSHVYFSSSAAVATGFLAGLA